MQCCKFYYILVFAQIATIVATIAKLILAIFANKLQKFSGLRPWIDKEEEKKEIKTMAIDKCIGKPMRIAVGNREKLFSMNKILEKVELYVDTEGNVYMVPVEEE